MFRAPPRGRLTRKRAVDATVVAPLPACDAAPKVDDSSSVKAAEDAAAAMPSEGLLDTRLAPVPKHRPLRRAATLSKFLQVGGNHKGWGAFVKAVRAAPHRAILLSGPTGCGKTRGIVDAANNCLGMTVSELNATSVHGTEEFRRKVLGVTCSRTLLGPRILLVDDIEGFDESYISTLAKILKDRREGAGPMVLTCRNPFDRALLCFRSLELNQIRLYTPSTTQLCEAARVVRQDMAESVILHHADGADGNFHQLFLRLRTFINSAPDAHVGLFETTEQLLTGRASVEDWLRSAEPHVLTSILYENYPSICAERDDDHDWHAYSDVLSETRGLPEEYALTCIALSASQRLPMRRPMPLRLPKRSRAGDRGGSVSARDVPALLFGR